MAHYNPKKEKAAGKVAGRFLLTVQLRTITEMSLLRQFRSPICASEPVVRSRGLQPGYVGDLAGRP
jgi:hypothetical protein